MAHPCDHYEKTSQNFSHLPTSRLHLSSSHSKPSDNAHTLVSNFIHSNSTWSIDSLFVYLMRQYKDYDVTPAIIAAAMKEYIESKGDI